MPSHQASISLYLVQISQTTKKKVKEDYILFTGREDQVKRRDHYYFVNPVRLSQYKFKEPDMTWENQTAHEQD